MLDGSQPLIEEDKNILAGVKDNLYLIVLNKSDLQSFKPNGGKELNGHSPIIVSAKTGTGLDDLRAAILKPFAARDVQEHGLLITDARHFDLLRRTVNSLSASEELIRQHVSEELVLVGLYDALRFLGEITGETTPEDVLSQIFATFCIGK